MLVTGIPDAGVGVPPVTPVTPRKFEFFEPKPCVVGTVSVLLFRRTSPLNRKECLPCVQLSVSEYVKVGVVSNDVPVKMQVLVVDATDAAGGRAPLCGLQKLSGEKSGITRRPATF